MSLQEEQECGGRGEPEEGRVVLLRAVLWNVALQWK